MATQTKTTGLGKTWLQGDKRTPCITRPPRAAGEAAEQKGAGSSVAVRGDKLELFLDKAVGPERLVVEVRLEHAAIRAVRDLHWVGWMVFQALAEADAPATYRNGEIIGEGGSNFEVACTHDTERQEDVYTCSWDAATPLLDDPDVIDLEIIEKRLALPAGA